METSTTNSILVLPRNAHFFKFQQVVVPFLNEIELLNPLQYIMILKANEDSWIAADPKLVAELLLTKTFAFPNSINSGMDTMRLNDI